MGLSVIDYLEIYTNPKDLEINIAKDTPTKEYVILFCRGLGHNYKTLLTSAPFSEKLEDAIDAMQIILESAIEVGRTFNLEEESPKTPVLNELASRIKTGEVLNFDILEKIISELKEKQTASTQKLLENYVWEN